MQNFALYGKKVCMLLRFLSGFASEFFIFGMFWADVDHFCSFCQQVRPLMNHKWVLYGLSNNGSYFQYSWGKLKGLMGGRHPMIGSWQQFSL